MQLVVVTLENTLSLDDMFYTAFYWLCFCQTSVETFCRRHTAENFIVFDNHVTFVY
jgi:hypothetical protein